MSTVRNLQYVNGQLSYRGYSIAQVMGIGEECYGQNTKLILLLTLC